MLGSIKRWFSGSARHSGWQAVASWAAAGGHGFKRTRHGDGFVVESRATQGWRLEWGPSQRVYIKGPELRLRAELKSGEKLQMLVVSRSLMEALEGQVFAQFTEGLQTRADTDTPEEMRWLVMFPKSGQLDNRALREGFGAVANSPQALAAWLAGSLTAKLEEAQSGWLAPEDALALVVQRGRLTLRYALAAPDASRIAAALGLYEVALNEARRVAELWGSSSAQTTQPSLWSGSVVDTPEPPSRT